jgi:peptidyl-prolyl cis-trans isomerase SurA
MLFSSTVIQAQEIIKDSVKHLLKKVVTGKRLKIDGVIATVGDYIILDSDIDKSFLEISTSGNSIITRCQMLGDLEDKLYAQFRTVLK